MQLRSMIASWLLDMLSREWSWRTALRRIAGELASMPPMGREHLKVIDVARALEHVEPDRRFAISCYQQAVPELDDGRALLLAIEGGWWPLVCQVAMRERTATGSLEAMVWEARALVDTGDRERADKLLPRVPSDLRLAALRAELTGGSQVVLDRWLARAAEYTGEAAAESYLIAARQARALRRSDWPEMLQAAAYAEVSHAGAASMLIEHCFGDGRRDSRGLLELLRHRLEVFEGRGDLVAWCDATRLVAMRLWLGSGATRHRGLARRLLAAALERAYRDRLSEIPGHLAMWTVLDEAATADETRTELLPLVVKALDAPLPVADRVWLAVLGAEICSSAGNLDAAGAYAAVALAHAPEHPVVKAMMSGNAAPPPPRAAVVELEAFRDALSQLDVEPWQELQIEEMAPLDPDELGLVRGVVTMVSQVALEDALEHAVDREEGRAVLLEEEAEATEISAMQKNGSTGSSTDDGWTDEEADEDEDADEDDGEPHTAEEVTVAAVAQGAATVEQVVAQAQQAERKRAESAERRRALDAGWGDDDDGDGSDAKATSPTPRITTSSLPRLGTQPVRPMTAPVRLGTEPVRRERTAPVVRLGTMPISSAEGTARTSAAKAGAGASAMAEGTAAKGKSAVAPTTNPAPVHTVPGVAPPPAAGKPSEERGGGGGGGGGGGATFARPGTAPLGSASQVQRPISTPVAVTPSSRGMSTPISAMPAAEAGAMPSSMALSAAPAAPASSASRTAGSGGGATREPGPTASAPPLSSGISASAPAPRRDPPGSGRGNRVHEAFAPIREEVDGAPPAAALGTACTARISKPNGLVPRTAPLALPAGAPNPGQAPASATASPTATTGILPALPGAAAPASPTASPTATTGVIPSIPAGSSRPPTGPSPSVIAARAALRSGPIPVTPTPTPASAPTVTGPVPIAGGIIPSVAKSALGGLRPKPLPPLPPPPAAKPRAQRMTVSMDLRLFLGERELTIQSRDVSTSGLFAVTSEELPLGAVLTCELSVPSSGLSEEIHRAQLRVVRRSSIGYGCELVDPPPALISALTRLGPTLP